MPDEPGWYPHPQMAATLCYWDGTGWTQHTAPAAPDASADAGKVPCPYCQTNIAPGLQRCPQCGGEFRFCPRCQQMTTVVTNSKFVGMARGGTKTQYRCGECRYILEGPRW